MRWIWLVVLVGCSTGGAPTTSTDAGGDRVGDVEVGWSSQVCTGELQEGTNWPKGHTYDLPAGAVWISLTCYGDTCEPSEPSITATASTTRLGVACGKNYDRTEVRWVAP